MKDDFLEIICVIIAMAFIIWMLVEAIPESNTHRWRKMQNRLTVSIDAECR